MLIDRLTRTEIPHDKPIEVELNPFIRERIDAGELAVLSGDLPEPAPAPQPEPEPEPERRGSPEAASPRKPRSAAHK
jgi:hypothetical protein